LYCWLSIEDTLNDITHLFLIACTLGIVIWYVKIQLQHGMTENILLFVGYVYAWYEVIIVV